MSLVLTGLGEAAGAERRPMGARIAADDAGTTCGAVVNGMVLCGSVRSAVCTDGVTESATADGNSHSGWHRPQRWSQEGHSAGQCEDSVGVGGRQGPSWRARTSRRRRVSVRAWEEPVSVCRWRRGYCDDPDRAGWLANMPVMGRHTVAWDGVENREESDGIFDGTFGEQDRCGQ